MTWFMGIDIGSVYSKGVVIQDNKIAAYHVTRSGANYRATAEKIRDELLFRFNLDRDDVTRTVATGSGAGNAHFAEQQISDMVCTARGTNSIFPSARTVIDVAGQSTKMMRIDDHGLVTNFVVSEKCASGSARFIEVIANVLRINLEEFGPLSLQSENPITFSTGCAVFGESEAISRVAEGIPKEDIAGGVNKALAEKISSLANRIKLEKPCAICGGGALNMGLVKTIEHKMNISLLLDSNPQITTALGAALVASTTNA